MIITCTNGHEATVIYCGTFEVLSFGEGTIILFTVKSRLWILETPTFSTPWYLQGSDTRGISWFNFDIFGMI